MFKNFNNPTSKKEFLMEAIDKQVLKAVEDAAR